MQYRPVRWNCHAEIGLRTETGEEQQVIAQSVSSTGLRVYRASGLQPGGAVTIVANGQDLPARIAWVGGSKAGLEFDTPQTRKSLVAAGLRHR